MTSFLKFLFLYPFFYHFIHFFDVVFDVFLSSYHRMCIILQRLSVDNYSLQLVLQQQLYSVLSTLNF